MRIFHSLTFVELGENYYRLQNPSGAPTFVETGKKYYRQPKPPQSCPELQTIYMMIWFWGRDLMFVSVGSRVDESREGEGQLPVQSSRLEALAFGAAAERLAEWGLERVEG